MRIIGGFFKFLSWIVIAMIVVYLAVAAPMILGYRPMVVLSGSMEPTYPIGSITYYKHCDFSVLKQGDAITFEAGDGLVTHRIAEKRDFERTVVTKGDANMSEDPNPVEENKIVGRTTKLKIPYLGYFVQRCKSPLVLIPAALILVMDYVFSLVDDSRKKKSKGKESTEKDNTVDENI